MLNKFNTQWVSATSYSVCSRSCTSWILNNKTHKLLYRKQCFVAIEKRMSQVDLRNALVGLLILLSSVSNNSLMFNCFIACAVFYVSKMKVIAWC